MISRRQATKNNNTMNKKDYQKPAMREVKIQVANIICTSTGVADVETGDIGISYGGGGSGPAHARSFGGALWGDEE